MFSDSPNVAAIKIRMKYSILFLFILYHRITSIC